MGMRCLGQRLVLAALSGLLLCVASVQARTQIDVMVAITEDAADKVDGDALAEQIIAELNERLHSLAPDAQWGVVLAGGRPVVVALASPGGPGSTQCHLQAAAAAADYEKRLPLAGGNKTLSQARYEAKADVLLLVTDQGATGPSPSGQITLALMAEQAGRDAQLSVAAVGHEDAKRGGGREALLSMFLKAGDAAKYLPRTYRSLAAVLDGLPADTTDTFRAALEQAKAAPTRTDFLRLRALSTRAEGYSPLRHVHPAYAEALGEAADALREQDHGAAKAACERVLAIDYLDIQGHYYCARAAEGAGDDAGQQLHDGFGRGLLRSMYATGDGRCQATAIEAVSIAEERALIALSGYKRGTSQALRSEGNLTDAIQAQPYGEGDARLFYFNMNIANAFYQTKKGAGKP
ncbi:MAG: hypothetical protein AAGA68_25300 [Pseudomonadota bacterium]